MELMANKDSGAKIPGKKATIKLLFGGNLMRKQRIVFKWLAKIVAITMLFKLCQYRLQCQHSRQILKPVIGLIQYW